MAISSTGPLWTDLINSDWHDHRGSGAREDRIGNDIWLELFLARAGWRGPLPGPAERNGLRNLRALLRGMVDMLISGKGLGRAKLRTLNDVMAAGPLVPRLVAHRSGWQLSREQPIVGIDSVMAAVAVAFASMVAGVDPTRIEICANPDCGWVICDESHNRTRRWCSVKECGNLIKVRAFRTRRRRLANRGGTETNSLSTIN
jgi:predicted RNA-binding Zn ribbon-like protein